MAYFDQPEGSEWLYRFDVLDMNREHRRILNVQPRRKEIYYITDNYDTFALVPPVSVMIYDFEILAN